MGWHRGDFHRRDPHRPVNSAVPATLTPSMSSPFCNVALPVPLRTTFTYFVPEQLRPSLQLGCRVLVPFRKKSLVGVVLDFVEQPPDNTKLKNIERALDVIPALTPKLLELG